MRFRLISPLFAAALITCSARAAVSLPTDSAATLPAETDNMVKPAIEAFQSGRHAKAIDLAKPLAEKGNADALYLMGFAHETGQGAEASREKALEFYRKAAELKQKDAIYRMSFLLLASDKQEEREQAKQALESAVKDDPTVAARILGEAYLRGRLSSQADPEKAVFWWKQASEAGDIPSMMLLGRFYEGQFGFPEKKDLKEAYAAYSKAAGLGNAAAMAALGSRLLSGEEKSRDENKGREWLKKAVAAKEYSAYLVLGDFEENVKKDLKAALAEYERGKDAGQVDCILRSADFYLDGKGVEKDPERGTALLNKAAEAGSPVAHFRLAVQKLSGEKPDVLPGYGHLLAAANGNLVEAQNELGLFYLSGKLATADQAAGVAWLTQAAKNNYAPAQNNLATLYERGAAGLPQNIQNAGQLYSLAANQGHGPATLALARLINEGIGTKADPAKAWALATLADERGEKQGSQLAREIAAKLDDAQQKAAKEELEKLKSENPAATAPPADAPKPAAPAKETKKDGKP